MQPIVVFSYLSNRKQFVMINCFNSEMESLKYGVLYINDFHGTKFSKLHFVDDTFLLNIQNTISKINKLLNKELKELSFWLNIIALLSDIAFRQGEV